MLSVYFMYSYNFCGKPLFKAQMKFPIQLRQDYFFLNISAYIVRLMDGKIKSNIQYFPLIE